MDKELQKLGWLIKLMDAFEQRMYQYCEGGQQSMRMRRYISSRYGYFFDWISEED